MLATCITVVNIGYLSLAISKTIEEALLANRIAYLGSVFLPMAMFMIIIRTCKINYVKWMPSILLCISVCVFCIAASPGYLDIYYKEVSIKNINGCTVLHKTYGSWHVLYLIYLVVYFGAMIVSIVQAAISKKIASYINSVLLAGAVWVNIGVWMLGQIIDIEFEFLSVSYIITEFFIMCLYIFMQEQEKIFEKKENQNMYSHGSNNISSMDNSDYSINEVIVDKEQDCMVEQFNEQKEHFILGVKNLTPKERTIYNYYIQGKLTKEIIKELEITENTLKYHNKNIYGKLGVSSRKQLKEMAKLC
jgi:DNA-binding CsgD family transcriptional regulator